jgi:hypothetical protein
MYIYRQRERERERERERLELGYNVTKEKEYFVSLQTAVAVTEEYNVMVNREELIGSTEYLML